ncbi:hypothetical protein DAEQUDRAFT_239917 [Daedalea quercina L-15889]|uniref:Uncharacterized protein n=1 Tax=Daedalea quercina L-15889 TaxID=1314783 RepID=A0A165QQE5_9APHY|nr:hypothetical protein DAEQUDRAFT_239917 [Daedalea quercina L-15889]
MPGHWGHSFLILGTLFDKFSRLVKNPLIIFSEAPYYRVAAAVADDSTDVRARDCSLLPMIFQTTQDTTYLPIISDLSVGEKMLTACKSHDIISSLLVALISILLILHDLYLLCWVWSTFLNPGFLPLAERSHLRNSQPCV